MKTSSELLEERLERYERKLESLSSFLNELEKTTKKHGTAREQFDQVWVETEHNIRFYKDQIAGIKEDLAGSVRPESTQPGGGSRLSTIPKPALNSLMFSSIGFIAGAIFGSMVTARKSSEDYR